MLSRPRLLITLFLVFVLLNFVGIWIYKKQKLTASTTGTKYCNYCLRIGLPEGVTKDQVVSLTQPSRNTKEEKSKEDTRKKIDQKVNQEVEKISKAKTKTPTLEEAEEQKFQDYIVILVDKKGNDILPDAEKLKTKASFLEKVFAATNELTFGFGTSVPNDQARQLQEVINKAYPIAKEIYGQPFFNINVRVEYQPDLIVGGTYNQSLNVITLRSSSEFFNVRETFIHEFLHAFHDDYMIPLMHWEEGMVTQVGNEISDRMDNRLGDHPPYSGYNMDSRCTFSNVQPKIPGLRPGNYLVWACVWDKLYAEGQNFFKRFNANYYSFFKNSTTPLYSFSSSQIENELKKIVYNISPKPEGQDFYAWYKYQYAFWSPTTYAGKYVIKPFPGLVSPSSNNILHYYYVDIQGTFIARNDSAEISGINSNGNIVYKATHMFCDGVLEWQRLALSGFEKVKYTIKTPNAQQVLYNIYGVNLATNEATNGFFGVVNQVQNGNVAVFLAPYPTPVARGKIVNGTFTIPTTGNLRGRFRIVVLNSNNKYVTEKTVTKNYGDYAVLFE